MIFEGFEDASATALNTLWALVGTTISATPSRLHQNFSGSGSTQFAQVTANLTSPVLPDIHRWIFLWMKANNGPDTLNITFRNGVTDAWTVQCAMNFGYWRLRRGGIASTIVAQSGARGITEQPNVGFYVWVDAIIQNAGGFCGVYLNGSTTPVVSFAGDTTAAATDNFSNVRVQGNSLDDIVILTNAEKTTVVGAGIPQAELYIVANTPNGDGIIGLTSSSGAPNWQNVDERPFSTADYNSSAVTGVQDTYTKTPLAVSASTIWGAKVVLYGAQNALTGMQAIVSIGGTDYYSLTIPLSPTYAVRENYWQLNPATAALWTTPGFDATLIGARVI